MEFDILNELVTSTVVDLFSNSESVVYQCKPKVKELEGLLKQENSSRRNSNASTDSLFSELSEGSARDSKMKSSMKNYKNVTQWMDQEAPKRLKESFKRIGLDETLLKGNRRLEMEQYLETMNVEGLANEKKKVKNQLKSYDTDFNACFKRQPNHEEKQPLRPLYVYYKKLKEQLTKRGGEEISQEKIEANIRNIKNQRKELREKIESFQQEFEKVNNRKIRYVRDISPIQNEYKKYKELKNDLQKYEEMLNK